MVHWMGGSRNIILTSWRASRALLPAALILILLLSQGLPSYADSGHYVYSPGTKFHFTAKLLGLSAAGTMEILENRELNGESFIFIKSRITKLGGLLGFMAKFLRVYKESNAFESYIDPETCMTAQYEVYRLRSNGSKKITEHVRFDREQNRVVSLVDNEILINDAPPDVQDVFSIFLSLLYKFNTEGLPVGKKFKASFYAHKKISRIEITVTQLSLVNGKMVYNLEIPEIPEVFVHPASIRLKVTDVGGGFMSVIGGSCTVHIPFFPDVTVNARIENVSDLLQK